MARPFPTKRDGDTVEPRDLNEIYAELRRRRKMAGAGGIDVSGSRFGNPSLALSTPDRILAQLTGPYASGYPWQEVVIGPGRTIVPTGVVGGPATGEPAWERRIGDTTLAAGATVFNFVRSPASNEWVFPHRMTPGATYCVHVAGCSTNIAGCTVAATRGTFSATGTTDATGTACYAIAGTGPISVTITPPSGSHFNSLTTTQSTSSISVTLSPATGYTCGPDNCCPYTGTVPYPTHVYPTTLYFNDGFGLITLTETGIGTNSWQGTASRAASENVTNTNLPSGCVDCATSTPCICTGGSGSVPLLFTLTCGPAAFNVSGSPPWSVEIDCGSCCCGVNPATGHTVPCTNPVAIGPSGASMGAGGFSMSSCPPTLAGSITIPITALSPLSYVYGASVSGTISQ